MEARECKGGLIFRDSAEIRATADSLRRLRRAEAASKKDENDLLCPVTQTTVQGGIFPFDSQMMPLDGGQW